MIHDGDYYSIVDKDKILSLLDEIEQNIIWFTTETSYDKADPVNKLKDQGHVQPIKLTRVVWRMVDCRRAVNTFLAKLESGL